MPDCLQRMAFAVVLLGWGASAHGAMPPIEVAVTFDDLPSHGPTTISGLDPVATQRSILATLRKHRMPPVYGFINGAKLDADAGQRLRTVLEEWLASGNALGNHTYSHLGLSRSNVVDFENDIDRNEPLLRDLAGPGGDASRWKVFRYPYLREGTPDDMREAVRAHLLRHGYRIAEVTIDFGDWAWNAPFARCLAKGDARALLALRKSYLKNALASLQWSVAVANDLFKRPIRQVLLMHVGAFDATMLDQLLTVYEAAGVRFISLDDALKDPVYRGNYRESGGKLLEQAITAEHLPHMQWVTQPEDLLDAVCR